MRLEEFIISLDLNKYEREIILFLSQVDDADAKSIYKNTKVPQGRIYGVLNELRIKDLIIEIPIKPKKYKIDDIKKTLKNYLLKKKLDLDIKSREAEDIEIQKIQIQSKTIPSSNVYIGREAHINAIVRMRNDAKRELLQIAPLFEGNFASRLSIQRALKSGVEIRIITMNVNKKNNDSVRNCIKFGGEIRTMQNLEPVTLLIRDSKEFILGIQNRENAEERMIISSYNTALLKLLRKNFFDNWKKAKPVKYHSKKT